MGFTPISFMRGGREFRVAGGTAESRLACGFVPVAVAEAAPGRGSSRGAVEIELGRAVLRAAPGVEMDFLSAVLRAMRASL